MNCYLRIAFFSAIFMAATFSLAQESVVDGTVLPFFEALKAGDVKSIEGYLGEPLAVEVNTLLRDNQDYPSLLRQRYEGAYSGVTSVRELPGGEVIVDLEINYPARQAEYLRLRVVEGASGIWKIVEQQ